MRSYFDAYEEHAKALRTWLVAYGIGAPVFVLSQDSVRAAVARASAMRELVFFFLLGVVVQVVIVALNKALMWTLHYGEENEPYQETRWYRFADAVSEMFRLDLAADIISIGAFAWATWRLFNILG